MGVDDGEWIRDETTGAGDGWPEDSWPDDEWPGDEQPDDERPDDERPDGAQPGGAGKGRGHGGASGFSVRMAAVVAVLAAVAGAAAGLFLVKGTPVASAAGGATPSASAPAGSSTGLPALPALSGNGNGQLQMLLTGRVLAVSSTSITIGGDGPSVTAAVTSATTITGTVHDIGGVKVGNEVSAQITGTASHLTATAIQDPS